MKMKLSLAMMLSSLLLLAGCSDESAEPILEPENKVVATNTMSDTDTEAVIPSVTNVTAEMVVYDYGYDDMDRGNYEYYSQSQEVVIDTKYYEENEFARGDVIAFKPTPDDRITLKRIIGLSGEKVKIEEGQVYIDGKKLDTFYGRYHRRGLDLKELKKMLADDEYGFMQFKENIETNISIAENTNLEEMTVPENHVYVIGDDWFRTFYRGSLPTEKIAGKVLGYES